MVDIKDWLTPMKYGTRFVVYEKDRVRPPVFLDQYTKIVNYEHTVELIEHFHNEEVLRIVFPKLFCAKYELVEIISEDE